MLSSILFWRLLRSKSFRTVLLVALGIGLGAFLHARFRDPKVVERVVNNVRTVTVEVPVLTEKIITKYLTDPKDREIISDLLEENERLKAEVLSLTAIVAELKTEGGGAGERLPVDPVEPEKRAYSYADFRMDLVLTDDPAKTPPVDVTYDLHQKFKIFSTTGRDKDGAPVASVSVSEVLGDGSLLPLKAEATAIFADLAASRWFVSPRIQGGFGIDLSGQKGGVFAYQWLKRGKSKAPEDIKFSILSPAVFVGSERTLGILPFSYNLGTLPKQPFSNVWVSPFISGSRAGVTLTATF